MERSTLGGTGIEVSRICLGTMTWGEQNTEAQGHAQMDRAVEAGVNFFDTAEMYPVPTRGGRVGRTEEIVGTWFASRKSREKIVLATKVSGPASMDVPRKGSAALDSANVRLAIDASLKRLQTDYVDLYQVHWPARRTNYFGRLGYVHDSGDRAMPVEDTLGALAELVTAGKVRAIGVSNETPWGLLEYLRVAERDRAPRIVSIQNPYSLLNRSFEMGLAEVAIRERIGLLAYSPLAFGALSGKYLNGQWPKGARLTLFQEFKRYLNPQSSAATAAYVKLARESGLDPSQMALAYVNTRPFLTANIIGATSMAQLETDLGSIDVHLPPDVVEAIEEIHRVYTYPSP